MKSTKKMQVGKDFSRNRIFHSPKVCHFLCAFEAWCTDFFVLHQMLDQYRVGFAAPLALSMDIIAFCEDQPDFIQFTNAHVERLRLEKAGRKNVHLTFLERAPLDQLDQDDVLLIVGHGSPRAIGKYQDATMLVALLINLGLTNVATTIRCQTCSPGSLKDGFPILFEIALALREQKRGKVSLEGAWNPTITGWLDDGDRVVPADTLAQVSDAQGEAEAENKTTIEEAKKYIRENASSFGTSTGLEMIAHRVYILTKPFFTALHHKAFEYTLPADKLHFKL